MTPEPRIGVTLIGGFLGAGKTTLVNRLLRRDPEKKIAVLVNDFGAINIDADLIAGREGDAIRLTNGCLCCGIGDGLTRALITMLEQPVRPEHLLIEASGVAEPWRVAELLRAAPEFSPPLTIVVVDGMRIREHLADRHIGDLARSQIESARLLVVNKLDLLDPPSREDIIGRIGQTWPDIRAIGTEFGAIGPDILTALAPGSRFQASRTIPVAADRFTGLRFSTDLPFDADRLAAVLDTMPRRILRLKGILRIAGKAAPHSLQFIPGKWTLAPLAGRESPVVSHVVAIALRDDTDAAGFDQMMASAVRSAGDQRTSSRR
ncbi:MAG TPA: CobW family GTP-binding protein [Acidiphilium sp.]